MSLQLRENKRTLSTTRKVPTAHNNANGEAKLRLQLEKEIDKLALLMQQVREQTARVQAAADAIGEKMLEDTPDQSSSANTDGNSRTGKLSSVVHQSSL